MKNHKTIRRIYEDETIADLQTEFPQENPAQMDQELAMSPPEEPSGEEDHTMMDQPATAGSADPMSMTVAEFIEKCKEIDPLICMGIESFIDKNKGAFGGNMLAMPPEDQDMTFSAATANPKPMPIVTANAPEPAKPFSLDQSPDVLNFPQN